MGKGRFLNQKLGKRVSRLAEQRRGKLQAQWGAKRMPHAPEASGSPPSRKGN